MGRPVPPYFDFLIDAFHRCPTARFVHLGHWEKPDAPGLARLPDGREFEQAQELLNEVLLGMAELRNGQSVVDVGCGFGGTLQRLNDRFRDMTLVGVNIDARQLAICRQLAPGHRNALRWLEADACALPLAGEAFDRVLCIEAMFHFASRRRFVREAARLLRPGGMLVLSDIVLRPSAGHCTVPRHRLEASMQREFGPWPELWDVEPDHPGLGAEAGLRCELLKDATAHTRPSHRFTTPDDSEFPRPEGEGPLDGGALLKWLHDQGHLRYLYVAFRKRGVADPRRPRAE